MDPYVDYVGVGNKRGQLDEATTQEHDRRPDPYAVLQTQTRALDLIRQGAVTGPSTETGASLSKRRRVDDLVTSPRLGDAGFSIEHYVPYYFGNRLEAYRFRYLRQGRPVEKSVTFHAVQNNREVNRESHEGSWIRRWSHVGNRVKKWISRVGADLPWFRTEEERD